MNRRIQMTIRTGGEPPTMLAYREERESDLPEVMNTLAAMPNVSGASILQDDGESWPDFTDFLRRVHVAQELLANGWRVRAVGMYDEEGVEGWEWTSPKGCDECVIGGWDEVPRVPEYIAKGHNESVGH